MKRFSFVLAVISLFLSFVPAFGAEKAINRNSGFERMAKKMPANWYQVGILRPEVSFFTDGKIKRNGRYSVAIKITELTERLKSFGPPNWAQDIVTDIPKGRKIRLSAFVKTHDVRGIAPIGVQCWDKTRIAGFGTTQYSFPMSGTNPWKKVTLEIEVPAETVKIRILCMLSGTGTVWFDDVRLEEIK